MEDKYPEISKEHLEKSWKSRSEKATFGYGVKQLALLLEIPEDT